MHHKQYLQSWLLLHHLRAICSSLCVWQAVARVQALQVIPGCGWCGATGEGNLHDPWLILFTDRSCELVPHSSVREALKDKLLVQVISVLFIIKLPCAVTQSERKKEITHTKLRRSLPCTNYWYDMMPVSWQECPCYLGLTLNPDSVLDVAKLMDFQNFFISGLNTQVPDREKTLWGHQQDTAEVPWKFAATEAEMAWGENEVLQVLSFLPYAVTSVTGLR